MSTVAENYEYRGFELREITGVSNGEQNGYPSLSGVWQNGILGWSDADLGMIDLSIAHLMKSIGIKGASLAIVKDENLIFAKGFGEMNDKGDPVGPHTLFRIAAVSKAITSVTIMSMIGKGEFRASFL